MNALAAKVQVTEMIAKHVPMKSAQRGGFAGLSKYITDSQSKRERVGEVKVTNCYTNRADSALLEILNTQAMNTRAKADKTYHLIISFAPGESPSQEVLAAIEARVCASIGFAQHQRISAAHHDTDSLHVHVAINKIHPQRYTIHEPFNAYYTLGQVCSKLEKEFGLQRVNHTAKKTRGENGADDMERQSHIESMLGWIKRECADSMRNAQSWSAMHAVLGAHGLNMHLRGNGLVVSSEQGTNVKASSIAREFSRERLEKKLGKFEPLASRVPGADSPRKYARQPLRARVNTSELYAQYKDEQQQITAARADAWDNARDRKNSEIEAAKRTGRLKRAAIKLLFMPSFEKKTLYEATSKTLRSEIDAISKAYRSKRQDINESYRRRSWADWLTDQATAGDKDAMDALRARDSTGGLKGNTMRGAGNTQGAQGHAEPDGVTKNGTVIYRVGASAVRDDGHKLKVSRGADQASLEAALRMAIERYGNCISVNGSAAFKESIVRAAAAVHLPVRFDDATLERRRRQLTQPMERKEKHRGKDSTNDDCDVGRRSDRGGDGRSGPAATGRHGGGHADGVQSRPGVAGRRAPPPAVHRVRGLSELGVVHVTNGGEVLLPGDVPGYVEHPGTKSDHRVRRHIRRPGKLKLSSTPPRKPNVAKTGSAPPPASKNRLRPLSRLGAVAIGARPAPAVQVNVSPEQAAEKYVIEREQKRCNGFDIPKHSRYNFSKEIAASYGGIRQIDGQALALLKVSDEMYVMPVDESTARRLRRIPLGQQIAVQAQGAIKTKGRSR